MGALNDPQAPIGEIRPADVMGAAVRLDRRYRKGAPCPARCRWQGMYLDLDGLAAKLLLIRPFQQRRAYARMHALNVLGLKR